jgi:5'-deoxynucleotidase YfbR-like HD superfamily hydrolase
MTGDDARKLAETHYTLLLSTIKRWIKIEMARDQSVAEHSFNVGVLALSLYDFMQQDTPHNSFERPALMEWAQIHDLDEIETGDIPADFKNAVRAIAGDSAVEQAIGNIMAIKAPHFVAKQRGMKDSYPYDLVKIADKLEEILFNKRFGRDDRAMAAQLDALPLLRARLLKAEKAHPRYDWGRARAWLAYFLRPVFWDLSDGKALHIKESDVLGPA